MAQPSIDPGTLSTRGEIANHYTSYPYNHDNAYHCGCVVDQDQTESMWLSWLKRNSRPMIPWILRLVFVWGCVNGQALITSPNQSPLAVLVDTKKQAGPSKLHMGPWGPFSIDKRDPCIFDILWMMKPFHHTKPVHSGCLGY